MAGNIKIFSGNSNRELAKKIANYLGIALGDSSVLKFSDGEIWVKFNENIRGEDVFIVQSTNAPAENLLELLIMLDAAKRASPWRITAVIPYFGYARQDRKDQPRVSITAKLIANLIDKAGADRVLTMDLHSAQIQGFFDIPLDHLYASIKFTDYFINMHIDNLCIVSPDIGGVRMSRFYAKKLNASLAILDKRRPAPNKSEVTYIIGDIANKNIIMFDDIVDTAGTLTNAANTLKKNGAQKIIAACTHPVLSGNSMEKIENSPISELTVSDTIPLNTKSKKIKVLSVANVFGEAIKRIHEGKSISSLFL
ncbi:ribose-phosphate diphosphokinase [candidate division KSB1 bacterium]|nr:MAG: ribose-phosphate diphosphokinase [candidate division KSB1 bacterium]